MIGNNAELLVSPDEVVAVCSRALTIDSMDNARAVEEAFFALYNGKVTDCEIWEYYKLLGVIFEAGRIQGIRECRTKLNRRI